MLNDADPRVSPRRDLWPAAPALPQNLMTVSETSKLIFLPLVLAIEFPTAFQRSYLTVYPVIQALLLRKGIREKADDEFTYFKVRLVSHD